MFLEAKDIDRLLMETAIFSTSLSALIYSEANKSEFKSYSIAWITSSLSDLSFLLANFNEHPYC
jgi:hypothetical protein